MLHFYAYSANFDFTLVLYIYLCSKNLVLKFHLCCAGIKFITWFLYELLYAFLSNFFYVFLFRHFIFYCLNPVSSFWWMFRKFWSAFVVYKILFFMISQSYFEISFFFSDGIKFVTWVSHQFLYSFFIEFVVYISLFMIFYLWLS